MSGADGPKGTRRRLNPYVGPRPFYQADADRFFGRRREAQDVLSLWLSERVTVLHGPSAVGKTSLMLAGVMPSLAARRADLLPPGRLAPRPARSLASRPPHNGYSFALLSSWAQFRDPPEQGTGVADFLCALPAPRGGHSEDGSDDGPHPTLLAAIDQFEDLFTDFPARQQERDDFIGELATALARVPRLNLMIVIRDDHLATLSSFERALSDLPLSYVRLDALARDAALDAVTLPLVGTGRSFAAGAADELVDRLRTITYTDVIGESVTLTQERVEPLILQIVCRDLWSSLPADADRITSPHLRTFGDTRHALSHFYDQVIADVSGETGETEEKLRTWIESTFITENGTRGTAYCGTIMTAGMPNHVADTLTQRHLFTAEYRARSTWYQLGQDQLISAIREANRRWRVAHRCGEPEFARPASTPVAFAAAEAALVEGNFPTAHRFARVAVARSRDAGDTRRMAYALALAGDIARAEGDLGTAEENLQAALSTFTVLEDRSSAVRTLSALADIRFSAGDYQMAAELQQEAVDRFPADVDALIGLAYAQWYGGSPAAAEATFTRAIGADPESARALAGRGQVRAEMQEYPSALGDLDFALALGLPPGDEIDVRSARALALAGVGRADDAEPELLRARGQDPGRARTSFRAGLVASLRGRTEEARQELQQALRAQPPLPPRDSDLAHRMLSATRTS